MEIGQLSSLFTPILLRPSSEIVNAWEVGQLIRARVVLDESNQQRLLEIAGARVQPDRIIPFAVGQNLNLLVEQIGAQPTLRVVTPAETAQVSQPVNQAIRSVIANQLPLAQTLFVLTQAINNLTLVNTSSTQQENPVRVSHSPPTLAPATTTNNKQDIVLGLQRAVDNIRTAIPQLSELRDASIIKKESLNSGLFLEAKLSTLAKNVNNVGPTITSQIPSALLNNQTNRDLKGLLFQLVATIKQATNQGSQLSPQLLTQLNNIISEHSDQKPVSVELNRGTEAKIKLENLRQDLLQPLQQIIKSGESALSRIQLNQLTSIMQTNDSNQVWFIEIPYSHNHKDHALQLRISRDKSLEHQTDEGDGWHIEFSFELGKYGSVLSDIRLKDKTVSLSFSAETDAGLSLLNDNLHLLNDKLRALGFDVRSSQTMPKEKSDLFAPRAADRLVDTHA